MSHLRRALAGFCFSFVCCLQILSLRLSLNCEAHDLIFFFLILFSTHRCSLVYGRSGSCGRRLFSEQLRSVSIQNLQQVHDSFLILTAIALFTTRFHVRRFRTKTNRQSRPN